MRQPSNDSCDPFDMTLKLLVSKLHGVCPMQANRLIPPIYQAINSLITFAGSTPVSRWSNPK